MFPFKSLSKVLIRQKAPSAKRCIKTVYDTETASWWISSVRKHRAPNGALRHDGADGLFIDLVGMLESTERQKAH